jgi:alkylation response protein AidB-like acyl-CoA dehydrogenase
MDLRDSPEEAAFREEARCWLAEHLVGEYTELRGRGGTGDQTYALEARQRWELELAAGGWTCLGWPEGAGGRGASVAEQVIWNEEYARAGAPGRLGIIGEGLIGPTLIHYGTEGQKARFLPPIRAGTELWCQGYSEPDAGSDLANVQTRAVRDGDEWVITGQKVWTSLAQQAHWCFVLCRTDPGSHRHHGLSYLLVPMDQAGIEVRPIRQLTSTSEFNETFFDGARTPVHNVVGEVGDGWRVALATLSFERGVAMLGHLLSFARELDDVIAVARHDGRADPMLRQRLTRAYVELAVMRYNTLRSFSGVEGPAASPASSVAKLSWGSWHRRLGELAMDVLGAWAGVLERPPYELGEWHRTFLFSRADTIYGGSNEIQRNIIGERVLGLPAEPRALAGAPGAGAAGAGAPGAGAAGATPS